MISHEKVHLRPAQDKVSPIAQRAAPVRCLCRFRPHRSRSFQRQPLLRPCLSYLIFLLLRPRLVLLQLVIAVSAKRRQRWFLYQRLFCPSIVVIPPRIWRRRHSSAHPADANLSAGHATPPAVARSVRRHSSRLAGSSRCQRDHFDRCVA